MRRRAGGTRTPNRRFWRPVLYQLSHCPTESPVGRGSAWWDHPPGAPGHAEGWSHRTASIRDGPPPARTRPAAPRWAAPPGCVTASATTGRPARCGAADLCHDKEVSSETATTPARTPLAERSPEQLAAFLEEQRTAYAALKERGLRLDLTRGKPSTAQLDLSDGLLTPAARRQGRRRGRRAQLRRAGRHPRDPRAVRRAALGRPRPARGRRRVEPDDDARRPRAAPPPRRRRLAAAVEGRGDGDLRLPRAGLRPPLHDARVVRHRDGDRADAARRAGRRGRRGPGPGRPVGQGHVDRADLREPGRLGRHAGRREPARLDADGRPRLPDLLGQRLRLPPPHRGRGEVGRHPLAGVGRGAPAPPDHVRVDEQDHVCRCRRRLPRRLARDDRVVPRPPAVRLDRPGQGQPAAPRAALRLARRACASTCGGTGRSSRRSSRRSTPR